MKKALKVLFVELVVFVILVLFVRTGEGYELKYWKDAKTCHADFSGRVAGCRPGGSH
jgi:hypothetical protein